MSELILAYKEYYLNKHKVPWKGDLLDNNYLLDATDAIDTFHDMCIERLKDEHADDKDPKKLEECLKTKKEEFEQFKKYLFAKDTAYIRHLRKYKSGFKMHPFMAGVLSERALRLYDIRHADKTLKQAFQEQ